MPDAKVDESLLELARDAWGRYLDMLDGFRPDLFRYCRTLTGNVWDAEDLVHDTLEQGFARLGMASHGVDNPRGYLLRIASNLWVSRKRREGVARQAADGPRAGELAAADAPAPDRSSDVREAAAALLTQLAPQERAAVVLKETFEFTLEEIADVLGTSVGAVKAALHRGRERLRDVQDAPRPRHAVSREVVDLFVERYNARDMAGMLALMLDSAAVEMPGSGHYVGRKVYGHKRGWVYHNFYSPMDGSPATARWETVEYDGELVVLVLNPREGEMRVTSVMRIETHDQHVARIQVYAMCPDTVREVAAALGRPFGGMGWYRLPREVMARFTAASRKEREQSAG